MHPCTCWFIGICMLCHMCLRCRFGAPPRWRRGEMAGSLTAPAAMRQSQFPFQAIIIACGTVGLHSKASCHFGQSSAQPGQPRPLGPGPPAHQPGPRLCASLYCCADLSKRQGAEPGGGQVRGCAITKNPAAPCSPGLLPCLPLPRRYGVWVEGNETWSSPAAGCRRPTPPAPPCPSLCIETALTAACSPSWASPAVLTLMTLPARARRLPCAADSESKPSGGASVGGAAAQ